MAVKKVAKNIKFEEALAELEEQVRLLESGKLEAVKQEVEKIVVTDSNDVGYKLEPFQDVEG